MSFQACAFPAQTWLTAGASRTLKGVVVKALGTLADRSLIVQIGIVRISWKSNNIRVEKISSKTLVQHLHSNR